MVTGLDLVELQFRVASGEALAASARSDLALKGHAIEARLYAEDPDSGFLPQAGRLAQRLNGPRTAFASTPACAKATRSRPIYDPMIAKLIAHGETRAEAIRRLGRRARRNPRAGPQEQQGVPRAPFSRIRPFTAGEVSTGFIDHHIDRLVHARAPVRCGAGQGARRLACARSTARRAQDGVWTALGGWSLDGTPRKDFFDVVVDGVQLQARSHRQPRPISPTAKQRFCRSMRPGAADGHRSRTGTSYVDVDGIQVAIEPVDPLARDVGAAAGGAVTRAPMAGKIVRVLVARGQTRSRPATPLLILEAMKMEHPLKAGISGTVKTLSAVAGAQVADRDVLCVIEPPAAG